MFSERTTTVLLSLHGAGLLSRHKLSPEQELVLRWPEKNREAEIRVVGHIGEQSGQHTYGVAFFDQDLNFWGIDFPPISDTEKELGLLPLVCTSCNSLEKIDDTSVEADVCATNEGVIRFCKHCATTTLWKPAPHAINQESVPPEPAQLSLFSASAIPPPTPLPTPHSAPPSSSIPELEVPLAPPPAPAAAPVSFYAQSYSSAQDNLTLSPSNASPVCPPSPEPRREPRSVSSKDRSEPRTAVLTLPQPGPEKPAAPRANRRKHPRVKVNYSACVRHPERGDDIVQCEDMSKGGLRFKSRTHYYTQTLIDVAVPYEKGQPAIFVPAQIVFVEELPEQQLFRYGVQYLKATRPRDSF